MVRTLGALVDAADRADQLATTYERRLASIASAARPSPRPKVYFEEWDDPLISGIGWVSELVEIAGGEDILPKLRFQQAAKDRIISPDVVRAAAPDVRPGSAEQHKAHGTASGTRSITPPPRRTIPR